VRSQTQRSALRQPRITCRPAADAEGLEQAGGPGVIEFVAACSWAGDWAGSGIGRQGLAGLSRSDNPIKSLIDARLAGRLRACSPAAADTSMKLRNQWVWRIRRAWFYRAPWGRPGLSVDPPQLDPQGHHTSVAAPSAELATPVSCVGPSPCIQPAPGDPPVSCGAADSGTVGFRRMNRSHRRAMREAGVDVLLEVHWPIQRLQRRWSPTSSQLGLQRLTRCLSGCVA